MAADSVGVLDALGVGQGPCGGGEHGRHDCAARGAGRTRACRQPDQHHEFEWRPRPATGRSARDAGIVQPPCECLARCHRGALRAACIKAIGSPGFADRRGRAGATHRPGRGSQLTIRPERCARWSPSPLTPRVPTTWRNWTSPRWCCTARPTRWCHWRMGRTRHGALPARGLRPSRAWVMTWRRVWWTACMPHLAPFLLAHR